MEICLTTHAYNRIKERAPGATFYRRMIWRAYCARENAKRNAKVFEYIKKRTLKIFIKYITISLKYVQAGIENEALRSRIL